MKKLLLGCAIFLFLLVPAVNSFASKIVLANDEWTLSNYGFAMTPDSGVYATNVASWFTGGSTGSFLVYSSNFGLVESSLNSAMTGDGHNWTVSTGISFDLATLNAYDGVFLAGTAADNNVLTDYVNAGGNVYLAGGTGWVGAAAEAAQWNTFLNNFGLGFGTTYNGVGGNIAINSGHEIFANVDYLYQNNGNEALDIVATDPAARVLVTAQNGNGLYAIYDGDSAPVPEPATMMLFGIGLLGLAGVSRKK